MNKWKEGWRDGWMNEYLEPKPRERWSPFM